MINVIEEEIFEDHPITLLVLVLWAQRVKFFFCLNYSLMENVESREKNPFSPFVRVTEPRIRYFARPNPHH